MLRLARVSLITSLCLVLAGCHTSEIKNGNVAGLSDGTPSGSIQSGYGSGHGDSVGGGGAAAPLDAAKPSGQAGSK